jgi:hypothetical protein
VRALGLALVSAAVLLLQLVQTRIFSVMLWHHLTYLVVTFTLLGFAAGGTALACRPRWLQGDVSSRLGRTAALFGITILAAYAVMTRWLPEASFTRLGIATAAGSYALLVLPMIFGGFVVALALADAGASVGRTYAVNMAGSALGCLVYVPALRALGGEGCVLVCAALTLCGAPCFGGGPRLRAAALSGALLLGVLALAAPTALFEVPVAPSKAMAQQIARDPSQTRISTHWDPLCRIDVVGPADPASTAPRTLYQDGDASTVMAVGPAHEATGALSKEGLAYLLFRPEAGELRPEAGAAARVPKVLAIGIGGGIDILQACGTARQLFGGAPPDFTGVEINATTHGLMTGPFRDLSANRYFLPGVQIHLDEGRSWLRRSDERYDIIQMTGTDTYAALASGSYVMSESYLYTAEAYDDFLGHLTPDGVISVLRFGFTPPREELRLSAIAVDALRRDGAASPADHLIVLGWEGPVVEVDGRDVGLDYVALLIRKRPFTRAEVAGYERYVRGEPRAHVMYIPGLTTQGPAADYFGAVRAGTDAAFRDAYVYNLDPVTDDNPFFFRYERWDAALASLAGGGLGANVQQTGEAGRAAVEYTNIVGGEPIGLILLVTVLAESLLLCAALVLVPLWLYRREGLRVPGAGRWVLYFFGLGAGYILLEVVCMQRFVLFLGNPGYALSVVLLTFLLFSGWGAAVAGRSDDPARTLRRALLGIVALVALLGVSLHPVFEATLRHPLPVRLALSVALLAPAAFVMGMPFPSGLRLVSGSAAPLVPWACGVNGGASVIASVLGILLAMAAGFSAVFALAGACYALAFLAARTARA